MLHHTFITADYILIIVTLLTLIYNFIIIPHGFRKIYRGPSAMAERQRKLIPLTVFAYIVIAPIIEESLFRHTLATFASGWYFHKVFNVALFGFMHIFNYIDVNKGIKSVKLSSLIVKLSMSTFLGYYLVYHTCFPVSIFIHCIFNLIAVVPAYTFVYFKYRGKKPQINCLDPLSLCCKGNSTLVFVNTFNRKIRKSKSFELINEKAISQKCISVDISDMPIDILGSIKKYNEIENKRRKIYMPE